ncbi:ubiquitin carboxyl-terminal hydrolase 16-like [Phragmites australis]|uniref:ubiquitin carboxyl-terminal hydrolase 16-like n=1 Tax=Phragmites australis TaxID=29695 RepID=UPI002D79DE97|nr:ubiquitin carboxyl-terminal hydrolase 16-like [Phragmites australis]
MAVADVSSVLAAAVAAVLVVLAVVAHGWLRRAEARREEVQRLAWHAAEEVEVAEREEAYYYGQYGGFVMASDLAEAPPLWTALEVAPAREEVEAAREEVEAARASPPVAAAMGKGACAVCGRPTTFRCKRCKAVKYCTFKCQIAHWREGHKDECHPPGVGAKQYDTIESVMAGVEPAVKGMPSDKTSYTAEASADGHGNDDRFIRFSQFTGQAESVDCSRLSTSSKACKVHDAAVREKFCHTAPDQPAGLESGLEQSNKQALGTDNLGSSRHLPCVPAVDKVPFTHSGAYCLARNPSKRADNLPRPSVRSESAGVMPNNPSMEKKNARQQTAPKVVRHYPAELTLFPYKHFVDLYNFQKVELHPFGLYNLGNSCYANAVLQCLAFTRPLTAYLLGGHHSRNCSIKEWCFMCELEKLIVEGKRGKSPISPTGILSHLHEIGSSFGPGREEDAHEFLRYAIDTMQSTSMKEAQKNGVHRLAEETTLMQLIFGGYLLSKIKCTKCEASSEQCERILDLTVEIDGDVRTLDDALRRFTSTEVLDGDNRYHCSRCKSYERARKKLRISEAPNILTIALKRYQSGKFGKINKVVRFKEHLNLSDYMSATDDYTPVYKLYAVVVHRDDMNAAVSGHYVCYVKDPQGRWHEMDDSKVKPVSLEKVLSTCAYMLLYARCSPRAPGFVRKAMLTQGPSRAKKPKQMADSGSAPLGGGSNLNRHQGGQLCKGRVAHDLTYRLDTSDDSSFRVPGFSRSDSSSLFSNSDAGSTSTFSSDSTDSTRSSTSMEECGYLFRSFDQMCPVSIPEEDELSYSRQRSSLNPSSSSGQDMDQAGEFARQYQHKHQAGRGVWEGGENPSVSYTDQGKHQGSSSRSRSCSRSCKLTEQRRVTGEIGHGPIEGGAAFYIDGQVGRGRPRYFIDTGGSGL